MGKSRGERRVIFSSSGAMPTTNDLRRLRVTAGNRPKQYKGGSRETALDEEGLNGVERVGNNWGAGGGEAGRRERERNAIGGGSCKWVTSLNSAASPNRHRHQISTKPTATIWECGWRQTTTLIRVGLMGLERVGRVSMYTKSPKIYILRI